MKTRVLLALLLMMMTFTAIYASEDPTDNEVYLQKTRELKALSERFKAETGFVGRIDYNYNEMRLQSFDGVFSDIKIVAAEDTLALRSSFDTILTKLLPFSMAPRDQLVKSHIGRRGSAYATDYVQIVNGYKVEGAGFISIRYFPDTEKFSIGICTVNVPNTPTQVNITKADAIRIYNNTVPDDELLRSFTYRNPRFRLAYSDIHLYDFEKAPEYRLCWVGGASRYLAIDAMTGQIYINELGVIHDLSINVQGTALLESDNSGNLQDSLYSFFDTKVYSLCDGVPTEKYTDSQGNCPFLGNTIINTKAFLESSMITMYDGSNNPHNQFIQLPSGTSNNSVVFDYYDYIGNPSNQYYNSIKYFDWISNNLIIGPFQYPQLDIITGCTMPEIGQYYPYDSIIKIRHDSGMYSSTVCHEMTHALVYHLLNFRFLSPFPPSIQNQTLYSGMDEALSFYFPCTYRNNARYWQPTQAILLSNSLTTAAVHSNPNLTLPNTSLNEDFYSYYECRAPISSAWWSLRNNPVFGTPESLTQVKAFDRLLINALDDVRAQISSNNSYRYKPRYFYNLLMQRVADSSSSSELNDKQKAIRDAYDARGLHFSPKVESISEMHSSKNLFGLNEPVHVKVSNCPQNTRINIYVVKHDEYTYTDGAQVSALIDYYPTGFSPNTTATTDQNGEWSGLIWNTPALAANGVGDYDIIVDIGSPTTPNGRIHYAFSGANVMDGFDGRLQPGFTVTDKCIDVVIALDLSNSLSNLRLQAIRTVRSLVSSLNNGDRINVFGFGLDYPIVNGYPNPAQPIEKIWNMIGSASGLEVINNNHQLWSNHITTPSNFNTWGYCTNLVSPFANGYTRFNALRNQSGFVLFSDGWHYKYPGDIITPNPPDTYIHDLIDNYYLPFIKSYTLRYMLDPATFNNPPEMSYNNFDTGVLMSNIASWGNGKDYHQDSVYSSFFDIEPLLNEIRNTLSTVDKDGPISNSDPIIVPFSVENNANSLKVMLSTDLWSYSDPMVFNLTSPSGITYDAESVNYAYYTALGRFDFTYPESGEWTATFSTTNPAVQKYKFTVNVDSDLQIKITDPPRSYSIDLPIQVMVELKDYHTPISDAVVQVRVSRGNLRHIQTLYDDGYHNDGMANDGVYGAYIYFFHEAVGHFNDVSGDYKFSYFINIPSNTAYRVKSYTISMLAPESYPFSSQGRRLKKGWNWVGFPRLQRDTAGKSPIDIATISLNPYLAGIKAKSGGAFYDNDHWTFDGLYSLNSIDGFKLDIDGIAEIQLFEQGALIDTTSAYRLTVGDWNWITYPCYRNSYPEVALANVLGDIDYILGQNWSMYKRNGAWMLDLFSRRPILRYGDSILIRVVRDVQLIWNSGTTEPPHIQPIPTVFYKYDEKAEYETIMVESIEGAPEFNEIGVFQNDVCIGARVFEGYPIQILAYSDVVERDSTELEFRIVAESKGEINLQAQTVYNQSEVSPSDSIHPSLGSFRFVTLKAGEDTVPKVLTMFNNYPNPFNPSTTIAFSIPHTGNVKLCVYNIKGQKVKELLNTEMEKGHHKIVWEGKDKNNRSVSSGIYFFRLESGGQASVRKAMLMK
jgi:hypothetical protein